MELIDTHGHLNIHDFSDDLAVVLDRARATGLIGIVVPGDDQPSSARAVELAIDHPGYLSAAVGLHPTRVRPKDESVGSGLEFEDFDESWYRRQAASPQVVAVGEVGLDTFRVKTTIDEQLEVFNAFAQIALAVQKPMIIHCRAAGKPGDVIVGEDPHARMLDYLAALPTRPRFVVHCFQGTTAQAQQYLELDGYLSFTGSITYSDHELVRAAVATVPLDRLMLETDSPFLSPVPYRGERNEPWKVLEVARRVADFKQASIEEVATVTTETARRFFGLR